MSEIVTFCKGCPRVPKGIIAEVVSIEYMDRGKLDRCGVSLTSDEKTSIIEQNGWIPSILVLAPLKH